MPKEEFQITFIADTGGGTPVAVRLKRLLNIALRSFGLKCTSCVQTDPQDGRRIAEGLHTDRE